MQMNPPWKAYQEEAADFFRSLGLAAETDVSLQGARTAHDIDVVVTFNVAGFDVCWLVECKHWKAAVTKLHVLALRQIVSDLGADRGIILCEVGFQSGAIEAANLTNVQVTSLAGLAVSSRTAIYAARLRDLYDRTEEASEKYWDIPKDVRIARGLRFDLGGNEDMYSGARVVDLSKYLLSCAFRGRYPIEIDALQKLFMPTLPDKFDNEEQLTTTLEALIGDLETRLSAASAPEVR
jgi:restriction system protein